MKVNLKEDIRATSYTKIIGLRQTPRGFCQPDSRCPGNASKFARTARRPEGTVFHQKTGPAVR